MSIREREVDVLKSSGYLTTYSMLTLTCIPFMVCFKKILIHAGLFLMFPIALVAEWLPYIASQYLRTLHLSTIYQI